MNREPMSNLKEWLLNKSPSYIKKTFKICRSVEITESRCYNQGSKTGKEHL